MSALTAASFMSSVTVSDGSQKQADVSETPDDKLKPSLIAMDFIDMIDDSDFTYILFSDKLITMSDTGRELGIFEVTVTQTDHFSKKCFMVHANSHGSIDGVPCGTSITAYVTPGLVTLEQQHHEYVQLDNHPLDRKTFIVFHSEDNKYYVNRVITQGQDVQRSSLSYPVTDMNGFITEGSNLLLQRLMVRKGVPKNMQLLSFDSECNVCPVRYKELQKRVQKVEDKDLDVVGIERTIDSQVDLPTTWQSYFMIDGHLTSRVQVGSPVTMRIAIIPELIEDEEENKKPEFHKRPLNWQEDVQLVGIYEDRRDELKNGHMVYMRQHPELRAILADFLQFLLIQKPDDSISFAAEYFGSFSSEIPNPTSYRESGFPTQFPMSRTNSKIQYLSRTNTGL